jgi:hypothetical protein
LLKLFIWKPYQCQETVGANIHVIWILWFGCLWVLHDGRTPSYVYNVDATCTFVSSIPGTVEHLISIN